MSGASAARLDTQKKTLRAAEQDRADVAIERASWRDEFRQIDPTTLGFIDETGGDTRLSRRQARAPKGRRACGTIPCGGWHRLTVLGALGATGLLAVMSVATATSPAVVLAFLEQGLIPALQDQPDAIVVMDNLRPHRAERVRDALAAAGVTVRYLPPYSPDLNPIEPCWSKIKTLRRAKAARSREALDQELPAVLDAVTVGDAKGWFKHCGYALK